MKNLILEYKRKRYQIKKRLREFSNLRNAKDKDIFSELCFCILTPQSKAVNCNKAIKELRKGDLLFKGSVHEIRTKLKGLVRFHNNKAAYIAAARKFFKNGSKALDIDDSYKTRDWLVKNIKGLGYKEASHFLRNIGFGKDMAIMDVHILKNLKRYKVINKIPTSFNKKRYLRLENKMRSFAKKIKVPLQELDLLFWSNQTGFIFK